MRRTLTLLALLLAGGTARALPPQSDHGALRAVPAPGRVVVDGKLDDGEWDKSGAMFVYPVRDLRDRYAVRVHAMWDADAVYLGLEFRDPTPMINNVDAVASPHIGWQADGFQARFNLGKQIYHVTAWYSSFSDKPAVHVHTGDANNFAKEVQRAYVGTGTVLDDPSGLKMAFRRNADDRGYVQELRLPWAVLDPKFKPEAGAKVGFTGEYFWGGPAGIRWPQVMWADPVNQKTKQRVVIYQNPSAWGELELLAKGNLPRPPADETDAPLLQGPVPVRVRVPADATHFSLVIDDAAGKRVRNLVSHGKVGDYLAADAKPGPDGTRAVEVPWDGRGDGPWDPARSLFLGPVLPAGPYTVRGLTHSGVGVVHAGSFANPGNPTWPTADGSGGWLSDHAPPSDVAAAPPGAKGKARVFLGAELFECGAAFIGLDAAGRKVWQWTRGGAPVLAANAAHAFVAMPGGGGSMLVRMDPTAGREAPFAPGRIDVPVPGKATGLAASRDAVAVAVAAKNMVALYSAATGEKAKEITVAAPGRLAFTPDGAALVGVSGGKELFRAEVASGAVTTFTPEGVKQPVAVAVGPDGKLYVADAAAHAVRVYADPAGRRSVRTLGEPGGHGPGAWNPSRLGDLAAVAVQEHDGKTLAWVVERGPVRRVTVWDAGTGRLERDYVGGTGYQGWDGMMSDDLPNWGYANGAVYDVDLKAHRYTVKELMGMPPPPAGGGKYDLFRVGVNPPFRVPVHFVSDASGKPVEYFCDGGPVAQCVFVKRNGYWSCCAALGNARALGSLAWPKDFPEPPSPDAVFSFNDANGDGYASADEVAWADPGRKGVLHAGHGWGYRPDRGLSWYSHGLAYRPVRFTADGAPVYDPARPEKLPGDLVAADTGVYRTADGYVASLSVKGLENHLSVIHGQHEYVGYDAAGRRRWSYPNFWVNVHGGFSAPIAQPGVIMGSLKFAGFPRLDDTHGLVAVWGNHGQVFLLRSDGVYVAELFTDQRMAPGSLPETRACLGVPVNDTSLGSEPFSGWVARQADGKVRLSYGHTDVRVAEVTGLDAVKSLVPQPLAFGPDQVAACQAFRPRTTGVEEKKEAVIARGRPDAKGLDGPDALVVRRGREEVARVLLGYDDVHLHATFRVSDTTPWQNAGSPGPLLFKTGDSVNLFVAPDGKYGDGDLGGVRVLAAPTAAGAAAVVYRPAGLAGEAFTFESPVRKVTFRHASVDAGVIVSAAPGKTDYVATVTVPWTALAVKPDPGLKLRLDVGVLFSDATGTLTGQRVHWADRLTSVVNDVPTEAEFFPARWGTAVLK